MDAFNSVAIHLNPATSEFYFSIGSLVLTLITVVLLWANLKEMRKTRDKMAEAIKLEHAPRLLMLGSAFTLKYHHATASQPFDLDFPHCEAPSVKPELPKVINLGNGVAFNIEIKLRPDLRSLEEVCRRVNRHFNNIELEVDENHTSLKVLVAGKQKEIFPITLFCEGWPNILPEDKSNSESVVDEEALILDLAVRALADHLEDIWRTEIKSYFLLEVSYESGHSPDRCVDVFQPYGRLRYVMDDKEEPHISISVAFKKVQSR